MQDFFRAAVPVLIIAAGVFSIVCSLKGYRFFWEHRRAQFMVRLIGVTGTKIFYVTLGIALVVMGALMLTIGFPVEA